MSSSNSRYSSPPQLPPKPNRGASSPSSGSPASRKSAPLPSPPVVSSSSPPPVEEEASKPSTFYISSTDYPITSFENTITLDNKVFLRHQGQWIEGIFTLFEFGFQFQAFHVMIERSEQGYDDTYAKMTEEDCLLNFYIPFTMIQTIHRMNRFGSSSSTSIGSGHGGGGSSTPVAESHPIQNAIEIQVTTKHLRKMIFSFSPDKNTADLIMGHITSSNKRRRTRAHLYHKSVMAEKAKSSTDLQRKLSSSALHGAKAVFPGVPPSPSSSSDSNDATALNGWTLYEPKTEFSRQGALTSSKKQWRLSEVNKNFAHIDTYPEVFCVPASLSDEQIVNGLKKRSKGRIPVLSWWDKHTGVSLARSAQPRRGLNLKRKKFKKDIVMLESFIKTNPQSNRMTIVDLRPKLNAQANRIKGAGFEDVSKYPNCELKFMNIANIHAMRSSFQQVAKLCMETHGDAENWFSILDSTKWLQYTQLILKASWYIVELLIIKKQTVLTHCSDGWDRASQAVCTSQLLLDPFYRTIKGFCVLIQKDFITYGHMFDKRVGHSAYNPKDSEQSPIFFQFMETVYNLTCQFPSAFEFNEFFLLRIMDELYSCKFGTFLHNSERERNHEKISECTVSLWTHLLDPQHVGEFKNPSYVPCNRSLRPDLRMCSIRLWTNYWLRWCHSSHTQGGTQFELSDTMSSQQSDGTPVGTDLNSPIATSSSSVSLTSED